MPDIGSIIQGITGAAQAIGGAIQQKRYSKKYENLINSYVPNQSIMDYYNKALERYNVSPTDSAMYKRNMQSIDRGVATGIQGLQDRRSGIAGISSILRSANDARLNTEVAAENEKNQRFGALGTATGMKAQEDKYKFENLAGLYGAKATGGANILNAGLANIGGAANTFSQMQLLQKMYGNSNKSAKALGG